MALVDLGAKPLPQFRWMESCRDRNDVATHDRNIAVSIPLIFISSDPPDWMSIHATLIHGKHRISLHGVNLSYDDSWAKTVAVTRCHPKGYRDGCDATVDASNSQAIAAGHVLPIRPKSLYPNDLRETIQALVPATR